ncbi:energy-coupling factor transporter transmembrane component T [Tsukamurella sp. 8F]|uniref:energy-coupling factor transporter transmembrane component T family protein n=1 Tax=unclassified Tsukamurella TaxID=2633480 RepID=UPI0023B96867|nr:MULTISPECIES: energy-coupling factor transporter transmembrane component T [unclassified Tsukamurella]MDF0532390.1 energy-coupling factor transporter transmembrane component T [Tsukamurella sp. 8J]MDF0588624.1 energy-coupling factor transporter transmembrane component T [Tsukamurella sp. 8F]
MTPRVRGMLRRRNPLAKMLATLPAFVLVVLTSSIPVTTAVLVIAVAALALWGGLGARRIVGVSALLVAATAVMTLSLSLIVRPDLVAETPVLLRIGGWEYRTGPLEIGLTAGSRVSAMIAVMLVSGLTTSGQDVVLACVQQLRLPYQVGYVALAAAEFIPRLRRELDVIRAAHTVRGAPAGHGLVAALRRTAGYAVPLLASSVRHAERVSMSMDARGFGSAQHRTERRTVSWHRTDRLFVLACWVVTGLGYGTAAVLGMLGPLGFWVAPG